MTLVITDGEFWCWRPCDWMFKPLIFILIFYLYSIGGSKKEP